MTSRRHAIALIAALVLQRPAAAQAQAPARLPRVAYVSPNTLTDPPSPERAAFLAGLAELGLIPGRNIEMVYASAEGVYEFLDDVVRDVVKKQVDVIVTPNALSIESVRRATSTIPIVMLAVGDPVGMGLVKSLGRPGGNITGLSYMSSDLAGKRVQFLREVLPKARRFAVLYDARNTNARLEQAAVLQAAAQLGFTADPVAMQDSGDIVLPADAPKLARAQALYVVFDGTIAAGRRYDLAALAERLRLPMVSGWSGLTDVGGLFSYAPALSPMFHRGASFVHKLLRGARPADLPVEQPTIFQTVINQTAARRLGIKLPYTMLLRADRIIE